MLGAKKQPRALIMVLGDPSNDPRPKRMIDLLNQQKFIVDLLSHATQNFLTVNNSWVIKDSKDLSTVKKIKQKLFKFISLISYNYLFRFLSQNKPSDVVFKLENFVTELRKQSYDIIIVEDLYLLPLAFKIKKEAKIVFDAREYYVSQNEESIVWRILKKPEILQMCKYYLNKCDYLLTISTKIANEYAKNFNVTPILFRSTPYYVERSVKLTDPKNIRLVHHGIANPNRKLEQMIDIVEQLDTRFSLDMYLTGSISYINKIKIYANKNNRVRIVDPVPFEQLNETLSSYDIGLFYNEPQTFNLKYCLPNKLFEFIQARLAVAISPSPEMAEIVRSFQCGVVADEFSIHAIASKLNSLNADEINQMKHNSNKASRELNFEVESQKFIEVLEFII